MQSAPDKFVDDGTCFACGADNAIGLRLRFERVRDGEVRATVSLAPAFGGWRGVAHGGIVMALLDEAMAHAAASSGSRAVTAELSSRFRDKVPIGEPITLRGTVNWQRRNVMDLSAEIRNGDEVLLASARGKFIVVGPLAPTDRLGSPGMHRGE